MNDPKVTIILPTTGEKGLIIGYAIESVLNQTVQNFELFVITDGAGQSTLDAVKHYAEKDSRILLFQFPKQRSRGTPNRHKILTEKASGEVVCYLCDRDLWTRDHLEAVVEALKDADFVYTQSLKINRKNIEFGPPLMDLREDGHRKFFISRICQQREFLPLSGVGHTMAMYQKLPEGWRRAINIPTDYYMWLQFLEMPECRVELTLSPTLLWFPTGEWGTDAAEKVDILDHWSKRIASSDWLDERWKISFELLHIRAAAFRVRALLAEDELGVGKIIKKTVWYLRRFFNKL